MGGNVNTSGSARRSIQTNEYGVSELGVMIAVSFGVKTLAVLPIWLNGALKFGPPWSTAWA
jgi:hypothetical protein